MATFFGEVILPSSRAFFDDRDDSDYESEDNESYEKKSLRFKWLKEGPENLECQLLIVTDGRVAKGFAKHYLLQESSEALAHIDFPAEELDIVDILTKGKRKADPSVLYKLDEHTLLLDSSNVVDITLANELVLQAKTLLERSSRVMVLGTRAVADFKGEPSTNPPFLRFISNTPLTNNKLELPNFVSGIAASVFSFREVLGKSCEVCICFTDAVFYDSVSMAPFLSVFNNMKHLVVSNPSVNVSSTHLQNMYL